MEVWEEKGVYCAAPRTLTDMVADDDRKIIYKEEVDEENDPLYMI